MVEAEQYFESDTQRECQATAYAIYRGADTNSKTGQCWWWLRTTGMTVNSATDVLTNGSIHAGGGYVYSDSIAVRPAMWIKLE